jgi:hypothetical protein
MRRFDKSNQLVDPYAFARQRFSADAADGIYRKFPWTVRSVCVNANVDPKLTMV